MILWIAMALSQELGTDETLVPSASYATENGPGTLWVNPANLAYDVDPSWGMFLGWSEDTPEWHFGGSFGAKYFQAGVQWARTDPDRQDWSIDTAVGIPLPGRFAIGSAFHWHIAPYIRNFIAFDVGISWRPVPWIGLSFVATNLGNPGLVTDAIPITAGSVAIRPIGDYLLFGFDIGWEYGPPGEEELLIRGTLRARPVSGLYVRASIDQDLMVGVGLEAYVGGAGGGFHTSIRQDTTTPDMVGWLGSDEPDASLFRAGKRGDVIDLRDAPPDEPKGGLFTKEVPSWYDVLARVEVDTQQKGVTAIIVRLRGGTLDWARAEELRGALNAARLQGKAVVVYLEGSIDSQTYFAASVADHVIVRPGSSLDITGPSSELIYLGDLLAGLGVKVQVVRTGAYKSAAEAFTHSTPSDAQLEQLDAVLDARWSAFLTAMSSGRAVAPEQANEWANTGFWDSSEIVAAGLADAVLPPEQLRGYVREFTPTRRFLRSDPRVSAHSPWEPPARIAVVHIHGTITAGSSKTPIFGARTSGLETVAAQLRKARQDPTVRAVVLRIDSPGGSAYASEAIAHEVERLKQAKKAVVVSMGSVAASGGYYVAAGADAIWAEETTLTGSIGVIGMKFSGAQLAERIGVTSTELTRTPKANANSLLRPWTEDQQAGLQRTVDATYERFVRHVASGRNRSYEDIMALAGGRVWSGTDAMANGLIDQNGGMLEAIQDARSRAGIAKRAPYEVVVYRQKASLFPSLNGLVDDALPSLGTIGAHAGTAAVIAQSGETLWMLAETGD